MNPANPNPMAWPPAPRVGIWDFVRRSESHGEYRLSECVGVGEKGAPESKGRSPAVAWQHLPAAVISRLLSVLKSNSTCA